MWSFATHAGAGMAIAGLTATYYALARRNDEGERERMAHEAGFRDGSQINRLVKHGDNGQLSQSQMLLRKELEELSFSNGSVSGLNVLYQQKNPLHQFTRSNFEITPIVSRVHTQQSESSINCASSDEEIIDDGGGGGDAGDSVSVFGSKPTLEKNTSDDGGITGAVEKDASSASDELSLLEVVQAASSENASPVESDEINGGDELVNGKDDDILNLKSNTDANGENEGESVSTSAQAKQSEPVSSAEWKSAGGEAKFLKRTNSPICFFKNPGFGNRYAVNVKNKKPELGPLVAATLSSSNINVAAVEGSVTIEETAAKNNDSQGGHENFQLSSPSSNNSQNSTQFLLNPALSQSNVSVCEHDLPDKLVKKRRKRRPFVGFSKTDAHTKTVVDTNPVEEMNEYNKTLRRSNVIATTTRSKQREGSREPLVRLRADPASSNLCPPPTTPKPVKPILVPPPSSVTESSGDAPPSKHCVEKVEMKKRVTFKEIKSMDEKVLEPEDKDKAADPAVECNDCNNNKPLFEKAMKDKDFLEGYDVDVVDEHVLLPSHLADCKIRLQNSEIHAIPLSYSSSSSTVSHIPSNSWISFPVRLYTNTMATVTIPWPLIALCVLVVIIAGFLGIFLTRLASIVDRKQRDGQQ